jgi:hypothetical protein
VRNRLPLTLLAVFVLVAVTAGIGYLVGRRRKPPPPPPPPPAPPPPPPRSGWQG